MKTDLILAISAAGFVTNLIALWQRHQSATLAREKRLKKARKQSKVCQIPDCGCTGGAHP